MKAISVKVIRGISFDQKRCNRQNNPYKLPMRPAIIENKQEQKFQKYNKNSKINSQFLRRSSVKVTKTNRLLVDNEAQNNLTLSIS